MTRLALVCLLSASAAVVAAPVPKKAPDVADLSGLHALIAKRADKGEWSAADAATVKNTIQTLLEKVSAATGDPAFKPPVDLDTAKIVSANGPLAIRKAGIYLIDGDVTDMTDGCLVLATGKVTSAYIADSVVVSTAIEAGSATNSLLVAADLISVTSTTGHPKNEGTQCLVVAGKRIQGTFVFGGVFHAVTPEFADDPKGKRPVSAKRVEKDAKLLAEPSAREVGDKTFKLVELKAAIAK